MKKLYTLILSSLLTFSANSQASFCEDFESLNVGDPIAQTSPDWNSWGELMSGLTAPFADDAYVTNLQSSSGINSLHLLGTGATGGPADVVLPFGAGAPYTVGILEFTSMFYVRAATGAYFNFQAENMPGTTWSLDVTMDANGSANFTNGGGATVFLTTSYTPDVWFELKIVADLTMNNWEVFIDGVSQGSFSNTENKIASLDLYPLTGHEYYVDDVCYTYTPANLDSLNAQVSNINPISGLSGQIRYPVVNVKNLGLNTITSFDLEFDYNGTQITENISGILMPSLADYPVYFTNPILLTSGTLIGTATVSNVNGLGQDDNPSDDILTTSIDAILAAENKLVIGEEATGTWCGWCPRGAVALNEMDRDYAGYFQGIAVHNGDPMADTDYDNGLAAYINGYPSGVVDRIHSIDPSDFETYFLQEIITPASAVIVNGAQQNGSILDVSLSVDVTNAINGNWKLACVLIEDSVTGTGGQWYQSNSYSGSISLIDVNGVDWMSLPNWVPDVDMIYRHVARSISPSFNGDPLALPSYSPGDQFTKCYTFNLDPTWNLSHMHIVGMLINTSNEINNASSTSISTATTNGYVSCSSTSISNELAGPDQLITLYPNPSNNAATLRINMDSEDNVEVKITSVEGKLIAKRDYGKMSGINTLTFDVSNFSNGIYFVETIVGEELITKKFIKE